MKSNEISFGSANNKITNGLNVNNSFETVRLDIGGKLFKTTKHTIQKGGDWLINNMLNDCTESDEPIFIDRDPSMFKNIIGFLRTGYISLNRDDLEALKIEVDFYCLSSLLTEIETFETNEREKNIEKQNLAEQNIKFQALGERFKAFKNDVKMLIIMVNHNHYKDIAKLNENLHLIIKNDDQLFGLISQILSLTSDRQGYGSRNYLDMFVRSRLEEQTQNHYEYGNIKAFLNSRNISDWVFEKELQLSSMQVYPFDFTLF